MVAATSTTMAAVRSTADTDGYEEWDLGYGATDGTTSDGTGMEEYEPVTPGASVEFADSNLLPVIGLRNIAVLFQQPGEDMATTLAKVARIRVKLDDVFY